MAENMLDAEVKTKKCDGCGANLLFNGKTNTLVCNHCNSHYPVMSIQYDRKNAFDVNQLEDENLSFQEVTAKCNNCGATISVNSSVMSQTCPFCSSTKLISFNNKLRYQPDAIVPFALDKEDIKGHFLTWIKKRKFAPNKFKKIKSMENIEQVYFPSWLFDTQTFCRYNGVLRYNEQVTYMKDGKLETKTVTKYKKVSGTRTDAFMDMTNFAINGDNRELNKIKPFDLTNMKKYSEDYLAGIMAQQYQVSIKPCWLKTEESIKNTLKDYIVRYHRADGYRSLDLDIRYSDNGYAYTFLPIWLATYNYKSKVYNIFINGTTGEISGKFPKSVLKILFLILGIVGIVVFLILLGMRS